MFQSLVHWYEEGKTILFLFSLESSFYCIWFGKKRSTKNKWTKDVKLMDVSWFAFLGLLLFSSSSFYPFETILSLPCLAIGRKTIFLVNTMHMYAISRDGNLYFDSLEKMGTKRRKRFGIPFFCYLLDGSFILSYGISWTIVPSNSRMKWMWWASVNDMLHILCKRVTHTLQQSHTYFARELHISPSFHSIVWAVEGSSC